jgi:hypothetical protein
MITKSGAEIRKLASRKKALLQTLKGKLEEGIDDIQSNAALDQPQKESMIKINREKISSIDGSIILCEVIVEHILDDSSFKLSILEINFFMNQLEIEYK